MSSSSVDISFLILNKREVIGRAGEFEWSDCLSTGDKKLRKEVIQPQLPLQLPCYDFVPVTSPALDGCILAVCSPVSGMTSFHDVTGGVYKARERIHRTVADARLLATPTSCRRVAAYNPN